MSTLADETINPQLVEEKTSVYAESPPTTQYTIGGLTKREYFAAIALQGILSNNSISISKGSSELAVTLADQLISALNKKEDAC